jgi:hypothetical protein
MKDLPLWAPWRRALVLLLAPVAAGAIALALPTTGASARAVPASTTVASHFVWTATSRNVVGDSTYIDNAATNGRPRAILFITPKYHVGGVVDAAPAGVWYNKAARRWAIFNEDQSSMFPGASFNVLVVPRATSSVFVHKAASRNSNGDSTYLSSSLTSSRPRARLLVTQVWNPGGTGGTYNPHAVGVWYDTGVRRWAIFSEDEAGMINGAAFDVMVGTRSSGGGSSALQTATPGNSSGDNAFISNPKTSGHPHAMVLETPNWNPNGAGRTYDRSPVAVWFSTRYRKAGIFNEDGSAMPLHAAFNLIIYRR